jgi:uncharacterized membrane protein
VYGKYIRSSLLEEIKKDVPEFNEKSVMAISELNIYRNRYIQNMLKQEHGTLNNLESKVLEALQNNEIISKDILTEMKDAPLTLGQRMADKVASFGGSWTFVFSFLGFLTLWIIVNEGILFAKPFDPFPFILLNLILSCVAALQAPIIMMSQNRMEEKDRERGKNDYMINLKSELEVRLLHEKIDHLILIQQSKLMEIQQIQIDMMNDIWQHLQNRSFPK